MKNILILAGGSGPTSLLDGLNEFTDEFKLCKVQVLINALDNGLSSGQCRQIFNGKLLGPSDIRKNSMLRHFQLYNETSLYNFLDDRFTSPSTEAEEYVFNCIGALNIAVSKSDILIEATQSFFNQPLAKTIDYHDFSMANLIYAGLAGIYDLSLQKAANILATEVLDIEEDFVIINSEEPVFINAITSTGKVLTDEVDIDQWDNISDRIVDIFFTDHNGKRVPPPELSQLARNAILNADIIIFSCGTQWTSLIPTYATSGFKTAIEKTNAKMYLVMNNISDTDMTGINSKEMIDILWDWLPIEKTTIILNKLASADMKIPHPSTKFIIETLSKKVGDRIHDSKKLTETIFSNYYQDYINIFNNDGMLLLDYDDTLVGRNDTFENASLLNTEILKDVAAVVKSKIAIVSSNSIRLIRPFFGGLQVFADNAVNNYFTVITQDSENFTNFRYSLQRPLFENLLFTQEEIDAIIHIITVDIGIDVTKIINKGFAGVAIRPIVPEYRTSIVKLLRILIDPEEKKYKIIITGRTTIDIYKIGVCKMNVISNFLENNNIVFVGDDWECGNDADIYEESLRSDKLSFLQVKDPTETTLFLKSLLIRKS